MACGVLNMPKLPGHSRHRAVQGHDVPFLALGLRLYRRRHAAPGARQAGRQARGDRRHRCHRHRRRYPISPGTPGSSMCCSARPPAWTSVPIRPPIPAWVKTPEARLAEGAAGELPARGDGIPAAGRAGSRVRPLDRDQPQPVRRAASRGLARANTRGVRGAARSGGLPGDGAPAPPRGRHGQGSANRRRAEALVPLRCASGRCPATSTTRLSISRM